MKKMKTVEKNETIYEICKRLSNKYMIDKLYKNIDNIYITIKPTLEKIKKRLIKDINEIKGGDEV